MASEDQHRNYDKAAQLSVLCNIHVSKRKHNLGHWRENGLFPLLTLSNRSAAEPSVIRLDGSIFQIFTEMHLHQHKYGAELWIHWLCLERQNTQVPVCSLWKFKHTHTQTHTLLTDEHLRNYKKNCGTMVHLINSCSPKGYFTCWLWSSQHND